LDIDHYLAFDYLFQLPLQGFDFGTLFANNYAWPGGMDSNPRPVSRTRNFDPRNPCVVKLFLEEFTNFSIFINQIGVFLFGKPLGIPRPDDAQPQSYRMYLLSQTSPPRQNA
jgi:hypothetical protein